MTNNFEVHYSIAFPSIQVRASYYLNIDSIGTTTAIIIGENILQMISWDQKKKLVALLSKNKDIKDASRISIVKNHDTPLDKENTDTLSWEIANYIFDSIKKD